MGNPYPRCMKCGREARPEDSAQIVGQPRVTYVRSSGTGEWVRSGPLGPAKSYWVHLECPDGGGSHVR